MFTHEITPGDVTVQKREHADPILRGCKWDWPDAISENMSEDLLKKHWYSLFNELKERWPDLTQSDLDYISGDVRRLVEVVQKRRHIPAEAVSVSKLPKTVGACCRGGL